jgi:hypothetical protein
MSVIAGRLRFEAGKGIAGGKTEFGRNLAGQIGKRTVFTSFDSFAPIADVSKTITGPKRPLFAQSPEQVWRNCGDILVGLIEKKTAFSGCVTCYIKCDSAVSITNIKKQEIVQQRKVALQQRTVGILITPAVTLIPAVIKIICQIPIPEGRLVAGGNTWQNPGDKLCTFVVCGLKYVVGKLFADGKSWLELKGCGYNWLISQTCNKSLIQIVKESVIRSLSAGINSKNALNNSIGGLNNWQNLCRNCTVGRYCIFLFLYIVGML